MTDAPAVLVMDLGGVTCRWLPDRRLAALARLSGLPEATVEASVFESGFDDATERGQFTLDEVVANLRTVLNLAAQPETVDETEAELRAAWALAFEPDLRVLDLVVRAECPAALFTNNGPLLEAALDHELRGVGEAFQQVVCSWHLGVTKPDPLAFERATAALAVEPARVLFVDDSAANVAAAQAHGWRAHHFRDHLNLRAALGDAGLLPG
ncbi:HAD-IA family hydrolase [Aquihabitans sp. G128]|uniref:HAD-IA family hydrolase n=1 Tax=Aquihabitans sp. G128 TaxID=2849779 RepID=UPI001C233ABA|nr:HAD-IA family hydrolase [Aquihabitans sp. G128]QXC62966.1 HAD-IA family hydrolase [Aquihabitans sp. G128]